MPATGGGGGVSGAERERQREEERSGHEAIFHGEEMKNGRTLRIAAGSVNGPGIIRRRIFSSLVRRHCENVTSDGLM